MSARVSGRVSSPRTKRYVGVSIKSSRESAHQPVLGTIGLAGHAVDPDVERLEEGAEAVVVLCADRVVLVVVAVGAVEGQAEERLAGVLDGVRHPGVAVEDVPVADQEAGGTQRRRSSGAISSAASISRTIRS